MYICDIYISFDLHKKEANNQFAWKMHANIENQRTRTIFTSHKTETVATKLNCCPRTHSSYVDLRQQDKKGAHLHKHKVHIRTQKYCLQFAAEDLLYARLSLCFDLAIVLTHAYLPVYLSLSVFVWMLLFFIISFVAALASYFNTLDSFSTLNNFVVRLLF